MYATENDVAKLMPIEVSLREAKANADRILDTMESDDARVAVKGIQEQTKNMIIWCQDFTKAK